MTQLFLPLASISGALAVIIGAFGAHGLKGRLSEEMLAVYQTGVQYHFYHTFALLAVALICVHREPSGMLTASGICFIAGTVIFSGSLYALALSGIKILGAITPIGGLFFIVGWVLLAIATYRH